jgi:hypothetical protein
MTKTKMQRLSDVPEEKQSAIRMDIQKYLRGEENLKMNDINIKHDVTPWITQKLMRMEIGFDTNKSNQL